MKHRNKSYEISLPITNNHAIKLLSTAIRLSISSLKHVHFEPQQRRDTKGLIKRYGVINVEDVIEITAIKCSFSKIAIGAIVSRKFMTYWEFFEIVRVHYGWII